MAKPCGIMKQILTWISRMKSLLKRVEQTHRAEHNHPGPSSALLHLPEQGQTWVRPPRCRRYTSPEKFVGCCWAPQRSPGHLLSETLSYLLNLVLCKFGCSCATICGMRRSGHVSAKPVTFSICNTSKLSVCQKACGLTLVQV